MKKLLIILALVLVIIDLSYAQDEKFKPVHSFGIKQGINYSSVSFSPRVKQGLTFGYCGGIAYKYQNEKYFAIQLELNFTQKGWTEDLDTINNSYNRKMNYIELPLITHVVLGKSPKLKFFINLGTSFGYLLSEKESMVLNEINYRKEYYEKKVENYFDFSGLGELGVISKTAIGDFQIGVRYQFTFTSLFKATTETDYDYSHNQIMCLSLTYFFLGN